MTFDPLKAYKTPLSEEDKKRYDQNWDRIFKKKKKAKIIINN